MKYNLNDKRFRSIQNSENGEVNPETIFYYQQKGDIVSATYRGGSIIAGNLIAKVSEDGKLDMRYLHLNVEGEFKMGKCISTPLLLPNGKLKFCEEWQWLTGDQSSGYSEIEEI